MESLCVERTGRRRKRALWASAGLCIGIFVVDFWQPDWLAPVTLAPAWFWLAPALLLTAQGMSRKHKYWSLAVLTLWTAYAVVFVEEARSLLHTRSWPTREWKAARANERGVRVVSLNCAAADWRAAAEVAPWEPDIVLLQESPSREHVGRLVRDLYGAGGSFLWGGDTAILARGHVQSRRVDAGSHFVHAMVELPMGLKADVISVRLSPPVFRLDFWMPGFWIDHRNVRIQHRRQILDVAEGMEPISTPLIVGGDFNAPPNDAALAPLRHRLYDAFRAAGHGWGHTGTNEFTLFRVDQVWISRHFHADSVTALKTTHSDHRMVVCDLIFD
jgi:endonuclease/exonuclease/phosphatase (EEP) superfamily protein YafD